MPKPHTLHSDWADNLRERRLAAGLTQRQLATRAGVSAQTISNIERGVGPSDDFKIRVAAAFQVDVHDLFPYPATSSAP